MAGEKEISRASGKWKRAGVPKRGWSCTSIEDLGEPQRICEMCEMIEIRYVHYMEHPRYPDVLGCGCICAGEMENDSKAAAARERTMRNEASRRKNWIKRNWKTSSKGNATLKTDGYRVTVFKRGQLWSASVNEVGGDDPRYLDKKVKTEEAAKLAAFDLMLRAKKEAEE